MDISTLLGAGGGGFDTSKSAAGSQAKLADDFDTFLKMLVTQLQSQDPLDPTDSSEFTNQLVQFTSVEQQITQNKNLEDLATLTMMNGINSSVNFIGKVATTISPDTALRNGEATWNFTLANAPHEGTIKITNHLGQVVHEAPVPYEAGEHTYTWDGTDGMGGTFPEGMYSLSVEGKDISGNTIKSQVYIEGRVEGVDMVGGQTMLSIKGMSIPVGSIVQVKEAVEETTAGA